MRHKKMKEKINENEQKVLLELSTIWGYDENFYAFDQLANLTKLDRKQVRRACRSLAKKGLAEFGRGLMDDDGMVAGSGYAATKKGHDLISEIIIDNDHT